MRRVFHTPTRIDSIPTLHRWSLSCILNTFPCKALFAILCMIALMLLPASGAPTVAQEVPLGPQTCAESTCVDADPLGWQQNSVVQNLTMLGANFRDTINRAQFFFPPFSTFATATVNYSAFVSGAFDIGQVITSDNGEIVGLFTLEISPRDASVYLPVEGATEVTVENGSNIHTRGGGSEADTQNPAQFLMDWTMILEYGGCATPIDCEFAKYDEASLRCYWFNPIESSWNLTGRSINLDKNRLTCTSRATGLYAIVARRAKTSGETEGPPVYLPIVWGGSGQ